MSDIGSERFANAARIAFAWSALRLYRGAFPGFSAKHPSVVFAFSLGTADANGLAIGEFGLLSAAGVLYARKVRAYQIINKDASMSLSGTWTIQFQ